MVLLRQCLYSQGWVLFTTITNLSPGFGSQYQLEQVVTVFLPHCRGANVFIYFPLCSIKDLSWLMNLKINSDWVKMKVEYGCKPQSQCGECTQTCNVGEPCAVTIGRPQCCL